MSSDTLPTGSTVVHGTCATSACYLCQYASNDLRFCGKGMPMSMGDCSGFIEGRPHGDWSMYPGCSFPVSSSKEGRGYHKGRYNQLTRDYDILTANPAMWYLIGNLHWVRNALWDGSHLLREAPCSVELTTSYDYTSSTRSLYRGISHIRILVPEQQYQYLTLVPSSLWWLDPTLSYREVIPMYALLMAVDSHYSSYNRTDQVIVLDEAFTIGRSLAPTEGRGRPLDEWLHIIHTGLVVPDEVPLYISASDITPSCPVPIGPLYRRGQLRGIEVASKWLQVLDTLHYVLHMGGTKWR